MNSQSSEPESSPPAAPVLTRGEAARLRRGAQVLAPAVRVGKAGVTPTVVAELERAFAKAEVVKVKMSGDRDQRAAVAAALAAATHSTSTGGVGGVVILYRPKPVESDRDES